MEQREIQKLLNDEQFCEWAKKKKWKFRFSVNQSKEYMNEPVESLELTVRSYNCLKRGGYKTINQLVTAISGREDLLRIRNLGSKSADEIMLNIFLFYYTHLQQERRDEYLRKVRSLNN